MARSCTFGTRQSSPDRRQPSFPPRVAIFRHSKRRRPHTHAPSQGRVRSSRNLQPRMLRRGNLMADAAATSSLPLRDVCEYDLLFDCVHCGLCAEACPTYIKTRCEMDSPRGRIYLMKSLAEGSIELHDDAARHLDLCRGCRGCETACPSGVHYGRLIEGARSFVERNHRRSVAERIKRSAVAAIFPYPARLRMLLAPLKLVERMGLRPALRAILPRTMRDWLDLLPPLSSDSHSHTIK